MKNYKVTAQCVVHIPMNTSSGATLGTLYKGATFNGDETTEKIKFLLEAEMIVELDKQGQPVQPGKDSEEDETPAESPKAPAGGSSGGSSVEQPAKLNARTSKGDLVTYAVANSELTQEQAEAMTLRELQARFVNQQPPAE